MPYIIDGHNLIPRVGLKLNALDDEMQLVVILREFCRINKKKIDVYFDGAPPGENGKRKFGAVTAHFVRQGRTADDAIRAQLQKLGKAARNWTVVSSDREVQASAKSVRAKVLSSDEFAQKLEDARCAPPNTSVEEKALSAEDVDQWLEIFSRGSNQNGQL